jgi:predicted small metal-binding protein
MQRITHESTRVGAGLSLNFLNAVLVGSHPLYPFADSILNACLPGLDDVNGTRALNESILLGERRAHMTKVISCRDVGMDCDFEARGETEQEIMQKCAEHARSDHGMTEIPAELAAKVRAAIHDEPREEVA